MTIGRLLNQTLTVTAVSGYTETGPPTYAAGVEYPARIEAENVMTSNDSGVDFHVSARAFLPADAVIAEGQTVVDEYGNTYEVLAVAPAVHGSGRFHHLEVRLG